MQKTQNSKGRIMPLRVLPFKNLQMFTQRTIRLPWGIFWEAAYRILSIKNRTRHSAGDQPLYTPYRSGFRFLGWYSDAALHKQIKTIPTDRKDHYILYAKWTAKINNYYNVEYYNYHKRESRFDKNLVLLKDLDYSFYSHFASSRPRRSRNTISSRNGSARSSTM